MNEESSFSYSALSSALRCNQLYKYLYVDKLKPEEPPSLSLHYGTAMHAGINAVLEDPNRAGDGMAVFTAYWESVKGLPFREERYSWGEYLEMGKTLLGRFMRLYAKRLDPRLVERRLYAKSPSYVAGAGILLEGTPDFFGDLDGVPTLLDFKTAASRYDEDRLATADQQRLYAWLIQQELKVEVKQIAYLVFIKSSKNPSIQLQVAPLEQASLLERMLNIEAQARQLAGGRYPRNYGACLDFGRRCGFWEKCHGKNTVDEGSDAE